MSKQYFIWCDESDRDGKYYTNFYGGILIQSEHYDFVISKIQKKLNELEIKEEIKWSKTNQFNFENYIKIVDLLFDLLEQKLVKIRIFFKNRQYVAQGLTKEQLRETYTKLYYQFLKHSFGLKYSNTNPKKPIYLRIYLDDLPVSQSERTKFKTYLYGLNNDTELKKANIKIRKEDITEVNSKDHLPLQLMDLVLGSICFRLNNKHLEKPKGQYRRGKRTIIKEKLYKHINSRIRAIRPNFNIGISTRHKSMVDKFEAPYSHWSFKPENSIIDRTYSKNKKE